MRVLVTRPPTEARGWVDKLRDRGFDAQPLPLIDILPVSDTGALRAEWQRLERYSAVMFVSGNAVRFFHAAKPLESLWPARTRAWAPGLGTAQALADEGVDPSLIDAPSPQARQFDSETLWQSVASQIKLGDRVLVVRGQDAGALTNGRDWLGQQLAAAGAQVNAVTAYVRAVPSWSEAERAAALHGATQDVWLFSSSQAIANLQALLPGQSWTAARAVTTHRRIAQAAQGAGFGVVCESRPALDAVASALESFR